MAGGKPRPPRVPKPDGHAASAAEKDKSRHAGIGNDAVERATGRGWRAWIEALDREDARTMTHKEIAQMLREEFRLAPWWAQMVTVGYEQATGARAPNQAARGFRAHASRTIAAEAGKVRSAWSEETPGARVQFNAKGARTQVVIEEEGLPDAAAVKRRKEFWRKVLDRLQASLEG